MRKPSAINLVGQKIKILNALAKLVEEIWGLLKKNYIQLWLKTKNISDF